MPTLQEAVRQWVRLAWRRSRPSEEFSVPALSQVVGIPTPALYRIENLEGKASDRTLRKIAAALNAPMPGLTLDVEGLTKPVTALGWLGEARAAIEAAEGLLRSQSTELPEAARRVAESSDAVYRATGGHRSRRAG